MGLSEIADRASGMGPMWIEEAPPEELQVQAARLLLLALDARDEELAHLLTVRAVERMNHAAAVERWSGTRDPH